MENFNNGMNINTRQPIYGQPIQTMNYNTTQEPSKKKKKRTIIIIGIILGIMLLCCCCPSGLFLIGKIATDSNYDDYDYNEYYENDSDLNYSYNDEISYSDDTTNKDYFVGNTLYAYNSDDIMYLGNDDTLVWYRDSNNHDAGYIKARYEVYYNYDAVDFICEELEEYGLTYAEQVDLMTRRSGENYVCLILYISEMKMDGEDVAFSTVSPYFGFILEDEEKIYYDLANMNTANYTSFYSYK